MAGDGTTPSAVGRTIVVRALGLRRGEHLLVSSWTHTLPWAAACVSEARRVGARPFLLFEDEGAFWRGLEGVRQPPAWVNVAAPVREALERADAFVYFPGPADRPRLRGLRADVSEPFLASDDAWLARARSAGVRGVRCLLGYASDALADAYGVPAALWRSRLVRGITAPDYAALRTAAERVARRLSKGRELAIAAPNGTDLRVRLKGRRPWVEDGTVPRSRRRRGGPLAASPPGAVVVAVDERSARGTVVANRPSFLATGRVEGGEWEFEGGRLRHYGYSRGHDVFESEFAQAPPGRDVLGLVSLGLNPALAPGVPHAEDQEAGTVTVAIGGNRVYEGSVRCRFLSWLAVGGASLAVDGAPVCDRGELL